MITFDDGYYDNFSNAYPVLKERNLPAVIFLTTGFIGSDKPFYWDYVSYCFAHTVKQEANLPLLGDCSWTDEHSRDLIMHKWIETAKKIPKRKNRKASHKLGMLWMWFFLVRRLINFT